MSSGQNLKVVFFGSPQFSVDVFEILYRKKINFVAVVTKADKPQGRNRKVKPSLLKEYMIKNQIPLPILQPNKTSDPAFLQQLEQYEADLFIVAAFGEIVRQTILDMPKIDCINIHTSLLPRWRGAAPVAHAILAQDKEIGVTLMKMVAQLDAGPLIAQKKIERNPFSTTQEIEKILASMGAELVLEALPSFANGSIAYLEQQEAQVTLAPKLSTESAQINWQQPASDVVAHILAYSPKPGAWAEARWRQETMRIKVLKAQVTDIQIPPQSVVNLKKKWIVGTLDWAVELIEVQLEGKKQMSGSIFLCSLPADFQWL